MARVGDFSIIAPNRTTFKRLSHVYPEQVFPFAYSRLTDPITGKTDSVLARCEASGTKPKIMEINASNSARPVVLDARTATHPVSDQAKLLKDASFPGR